MTPRFLPLLAVLLAAPLLAGQSTAGGGHAPGGVTAGGGASGGGELPKVAPVGGAPGKPTKPAGGLPPAGGFVAGGLSGGGQSPGGGGTGGGGTGGGGTGGGGGGCGGGHDPGADGSTGVLPGETAHDAWAAAAGAEAGSVAVAALLDARGAPRAGELVVVQDGAGRTLAARRTDARGLVLVPAARGARLLVPSAGIEWPLDGAQPLVVVLAD